MMRTDRVLRRCLADFDLMADAYATLAADYDWLFGDDVLADGGAIGQPATARLLRRISPASAGLDAARGTGIDAAGAPPRGVPPRGGRARGPSERSGAAPVPRAARS